MTKNTFNRLLDNVLDWLEVIVGSAFAVILIFTFLFRVVIVDGNSMNCTLYNNDVILVSSILSQPQKGDIVVVNSDYLDKTIVKRVIATAGQTVEIDYKNNKVSVDGEIISEYDYIKEKIMQDNDKFDSKYFDKENEKYIYKVPENSIFIMGDNRNHSTDSRTFGCVSADDVLGKVFFRVSSPYGKFGLI